ncbi:hypothetical protein Ddc_19300 [Ditylenchus destructor]|nr:hypothetical protein Ddc_19300 [Ditylenchus destructor]
MVDIDNDLVEVFFFDRTGNIFPKMVSYYGMWPNPNFNDLLWSILPYSIVHDNISTELLTLVVMKHLQKWFMETTPEEKSAEIQKAWQTRSRQRWESQKTNNVDKYEKRRQSGHVRDPSPTVKNAVADGRFLNRDTAPNPDAISSSYLITKDENGQLLTGVEIKELIKEAAKNLPPETARHMIGKHFDDYEEPDVETPLTTMEIDGMKSQLAFLE